jgi:hypothetical protein
MGFVGPERTLTQTRKPRRDASAGRAHLFVVLNCDRPLDGSARISLAGADSVSFGRAPRPSLERATEGGATELKIGVPDPRMSAAHARMQRVLGSWVLADSGSKNGTWCRRSLPATLPRDARERHSRAVLRVRGDGVFGQPPPERRARNSLRPRAAPA